MIAVATACPSPPPLYERVGGEVVWRLHRGQKAATLSTARFVLVLAGTQSGKTSYGPLWLAGEIAARGPGDYLVVAPTFKLLSLKLFPEFLRLFRTTLNWGEFTGRSSFQGRFVLSAYGCRCLFGRVPDQETQIFFCHAQDPDAVESATAKAAWLDEAGQKKFRLGTWEAVLRRLSLHQGRVLITTTPYTLGWLRDLLYEPWRRCKNALCSCPDRESPGHRHPTVEVVNFKSTENPAFPRAEYEERKATMPGWKFRMFYDGLFERPAGVIYEDFNTDAHVVRPFAVPDLWPRYLGLDFGGLHTAGVFLAEELAPPSDPEAQLLAGAGRKTGRLFAYREYPERARWHSAPAAQRVRELLQGEPRLPRAVGGAKSESNWRDEFRLAKVLGQDGRTVLYPGLPVLEPPVKEVEVGIDRVIATLRRDELRVFDTCAGLVSDLQEYSRELDDLGNVLEKIEDKDEYHMADALRYVISYVKGAKQELWYKQGEGAKPAPRPEAAAGVPLPFARPDNRPRWSPGG